MDLPQPSMPSSDMNAPRASALDPFSDVRVFAPLGYANGETDGHAAAHSARPASDLRLTNRPAVMAAQGCPSPPCGRRCHPVWVPIDSCGCLSPGGGRQNPRSAEAATCDWHPHAANRTHTGGEGHPHAAEAIQGRIPQGRHGRIATFFWTSAWQSPTPDHASDRAHGPTSSPCPDSPCSRRCAMGRGR